MSNAPRDGRKLSSAESRWAGLGPYYAMFPMDFAFEVVKTYTKHGDAVLDPFAGRGSSIYAAAVQGRGGLGLEINPVGWLYGHVKMRPAAKGNVLRRLSCIGAAARRSQIDAVEDMPLFFRRCFSPDILGFLLRARSELKWRESIVDATLMAIILVYLHGKREASLSNQMRQGKAMSPDYSVRWWDARKMDPPELDPVEFLSKRVHWRYSKGAPDFKDARVYFGDSSRLLQRVANTVERGKRAPFDLLFTSPPYQGVTNYHYDQWLRLWLMGGPERPTYSDGVWQNRFVSSPSYRMLLDNVFSLCARCLAKDAVVYIRTDARPLTLDVTVDALKASFPSKSLTLVERPFEKDTQTALFGDRETKPGEMDVILAA